MRQEMIRNIVKKDEKAENFFEHLFVLYVYWNNKILFKKRTHVQKESLRYG